MKRVSRGLSDRGEKSGICDDEETIRLTTETGASTKEIDIPALVGRGYGRFWRCRSRYRVLKGGKGSKKSATTALNLVCRMMRYPAANLLVVRRVMNTHRDSTFAQLLWAQERLGVSHLWRSTVSPLEMTYLPTGQKILFRGFDDVQKLASTTVPQGVLCWVWIEEAFEIEREADFDKLDLSAPRGALPDGLFKQTTLTFNPWSEGHWLKSRFFDRKSPDVSTFSTSYLVNEFLDEADRAVFERMRRENPRRYAVAGLGEWGVAEGLVYENWEVREFDPRELGLTRDETGRVTEDRRREFRSFFGLDYGYTNDPTAFICFAVNPLTRELYIYDEHCERRMLNRDIAGMIKRKGCAKERIRADAAEPKSNDDLRRLGISRILPSVKGPDSVKNGIAAIQEYRIIVRPCCKNTIAELSGYRFRVDADGRTLNEPEDRDNHLMDALRYAFYDVRYFHPEYLPPRRRATEYGVTAEDMTGNWE